MHLTSEEFAAWVAERTDQVQMSILDALETSNLLVDEVARHLVEAGGKMYRPGLVIAAGGLGLEGGCVDEANLIRAASVVELTHVASLYHDDVMDQATLRRGRRSAHVTWSNSVAILVGDFMLARASILGAELGKDCIVYQAQTLILFQRTIMLFHGLHHL